MVFVIAHRHHVRQVLQANFVGSGFVPHRRTAKNQQIVCFVLNTFALLIFFVELFMHVRSDKDNPGLAFS